MKVTESQLDQLRAMLSPLRGQVEGHRKRLEASGKPVNHLPTRVRWDWLYAVPNSIRQPWIDALYGDGSTDAHIDTALRQAVADLGFPELAEKE